MACYLQTDVIIINTRRIIMATQLTHATVFSKPKKWHMEALTVTPRMLKVLARIDGISTVEDISMILDLSIPDVIVEMSNLRKNNLIHEVAHEVAEEIELIEFDQTGSALHDNSTSAEISPVY